MSVDDLSKLIDRNIHLVKYAIAGLGIAGFVVVARSVRLATKFRDIESIPPGFFASSVSLHGKVQSVDSDGMFLVDHVPIVAGPWKPKTDSYLRVKLAVIKQTPTSLQWLKSNLVDKAVFFQLLGTTGNGEILSQVKWQRFPLIYTNLNLHLIKTEMAQRVSHPELVGVLEYEKLNGRALYLEQAIIHRSEKRKFSGKFGSLIGRLYRKLFKSTN